MQNFINLLLRIFGGNETQTFVGVGAPHTIGNGLKGCAFTVRTTGTIIASVNVQERANTTPHAYPYNPGWIGIALNQGEYFVSRYPIANFTLTNATDSINVHCDKPY